MKTTSFLKLEKENFKFSSAHFLIFDEHSAEMLHGHNYKVKVMLYEKPGVDSQKYGYLIDFGVIKKVIKQLCDDWDEHILLPQQHPDIKVSKNPTYDNYDVLFRDRFYSFPVKETLLLPVVNTSVEQLSKLFAEKLLEKVKMFPISAVEVNIEETSGQSATTRFE